MVLPNGLRVSYLVKRDIQFMLDEIPVYFEHGIEVAKGDTVFDIGANIGLFALWVNQLCGGNVNVYSFEPIPPIYEVLCRNFRKNDINRLHAFPYGISDASKSMTCAYYPEAPVGSTAYPEAAVAGIRNCKEAVLHNVRYSPHARLGVRWMPRFLLSMLMDVGIKKHFRSEEVTCNVRTVSEVFREHDIERIDLLKVDAEYAEMDVLRGIEGKDWSKIRQVVVEVHDGRVDEIVAILMGQGICEITVTQQPMLKGSNQHLVYAAR
jgi:FkbM family methyltransferase